MVAWSPRDRWQQERQAPWPNHRFLLCFQREARQADRQEPVGYLWPAACITKVRQAGRKTSKSGRKEQSDESKDEHESWQRNVGQLVRLLPESTTMAELVRIPGKEQSNESKDERESWQRNVGQLIREASQVVQNPGQK